MYKYYKNFYYLDIRNPFKTMNKLKGIFIPLKCCFKCNTKDDWFPMLWCSKPSFIHIMSVDVGWKDKFDSPRYEYPPAIWIHIWKLNLIWYWTLPNEKYMDDYWEQALWFLYYYTYYNKEGVVDINKSKEKWPWVNVTSFDDEGESSWNDNYLIKNKL